MKLVIIGDSHGNIANLKHVMGFAKNIKAGAVIHTGDWNNIKSVETVLEYKIPLYTVLGNADIDPKLTEYLKLKTEKFNESLLTFKLGGKKIGIVHKLSLTSSAGKQKVIDYGLLKDLDIVFTSHYHSQYLSKVTTIVGQNVILVRPGALENGINFAIFDTKIEVVEFINE